GSNGQVDTVDISQSPRGSRSGSRGLDRQALEQIHRIKIADDITLEQTEDEARDVFQSSLTVSPQSSNGSNASTPRSLSNAKPSLVLKRQGTFVQRRDGQGDQVELSPGAEIKRRLSAGSTKLHEAIADEEENEEEYEDDYENATEDGDCYSDYNEPQVIRVPTKVDDGVDPIVDQSDLNAQPEPIAEASQEEAMQQISESSPEDQQVIDEDEEDY
ncbi:hypothetical protein BVRB_024510, partial [Beta vulgaris subsp. vulgaris]